ncbi:CAP domain-containing protein [Sphingomonas gilva]|uniref:CAP domain-containing protein n=1 Tax=Sphingomonas gilva TaxID=2305907 RepID=UPI0015F9CD20|nr:CAP domain-containing protein [Sphingomonas gilva]
MRTLIALLLFTSATPAAAQDGLPSGDELLAEINRIRANPARYARELRVQRTWFRGRIFMSPDGYPLQTAEGVAALDDAIAVLGRQPALPPLAWSDVLAEAATDHAISQGEAGARGHIGRDGSNPGQRVKQHGGDIYVAESIAYGPFDAAGVIRSLIVDDGVAARGHRKMLLASQYRHVGALCAEHAVSRVICVFDFAATPDGRPVT